MSKKDQWEPILINYAKMISPGTQITLEEVKKLLGIKDHEWNSGVGSVIGKIFKSIGWESSTVHPIEGSLKKSTVYNKKSEVSYNPKVIVKPLPQRDEPKEVQVPIQQDDPKVVHLGRNLNFYPEPEKKESPQVIYVTPKNSDRRIPNPEPERKSPQVIHVVPKNPDRRVPNPLSSPTPATTYGIKTFSGKKNEEPEVRSWRQEESPKPIDHKCSCQNSPEISTGISEIKQALGLLKTSIWEQNESVSSIEEHLKKQTKYVSEIELDLERKLSGLSKNVNLESKIKQEWNNFQDEVDQNISIMKDDLQKLELNNDKLKEVVEQLKEEKKVLQEKLDKAISSSATVSGAISQPFLVDPSKTSLSKTIKDLFYWYEISTQPHIIARGLGEEERSIILEIQGTKIVRLSETYGNAPKIYKSINLDDPARKLLDVVLPAKMYFRGQTETNLQFIMALLGKGFNIV
jgi:hypothetical protein